MTLNCAQISRHCRDQTLHPDTAPATSTTPLRGLLRVRHYSKVYYKYNTTPMSTASAAPPGYSLLPSSPLCPLMVNMRQSFLRSNGTPSRHCNQSDTAPQYLLRVRHCLQRLLRVRHYPADTVASQILH